MSNSKIDSKTDYKTFAQLLTVEQLERIKQKRKATAEAAIPDLRAHWLQLLEKKPYSVEELVNSNIPPYLQHVTKYLPVGPQPAVAKVFEGVDGVIFRYGTDEWTVYCGLASKVEAALPK